MKIRACDSSEDGVRWDEFVTRHPAGTYAHLWGWKKVIQESFEWPTHNLLAEENGTVCGVLPFVIQKSWLFGNFASSMPFLNSGGILADSPETERALLEEAVRIVRNKNARYLELRHRTEHNLRLPSRTNKVTVTLPLSSESETMWKRLDTKIRTKVRKSQSFGMKAEFGGEELLGDFYSVWSHNMRDLGTPGYGPRFFREVAKAFPSLVRVCRVSHEGRPVAVSFLIGFGDRVEAVWSSSLEEALHLKPNMFLYWNLFCFGGQAGYKTFDFGRSSVGSGTHTFKLQWGGQSEPLFWSYWLAKTEALPEINPANPKYGLAIRAWQKLPLPVARFIGPKIARCLP